MLSTGRKQLISLSLVYLDKGTLASYSARFQRMWTTVMTVPSALVQVSENVVKSTGYGSFCNRIIQTSEDVVYKTGRLRFFLCLVSRDVDLFS